MEWDAESSASETSNATSVTAGIADMDAFLGDGDEGVGDTTPHSGSLPPIQEEGEVNKGHNLGQQATAVTEPAVVAISGTASDQSVTAMAQPRPSSWWVPVATGGMPVLTCAQNTSVPRQNFGGEQVPIYDQGETPRWDADRRSMPKGDSAASQQQKYPFYMSASGKRTARRKASRMRRREMELAEGRRDCGLPTGVPNLIVPATRVLDHMAPQPTTHGNTYAGVVQESLAEGVSTPPISRGVKRVNVSPLSDTPGQMRVTKKPTEDHTLVVTYSDIQRWSEPLQQGNLDQLAAALHIKLLSQSQPKHFFGVNSFGLAKGRGVIVCSNSQTKEWIQANASTVLSGGYKAWNEHEAPEVKRRRLRVFIVTQGELPPVPALLASLREQNAGLTTLGWYLFRSHHIPGRGFHTFWCVPESQAPRLVNPGLFWGFYHLVFEDLHPNKNLDQAEQDGNTVTPPLVSGEVATHSIATRPEMACAATRPEMARTSTRSTKACAATHSEMAGDATITVLAGDATINEVAMTTSSITSHHQVQATATSKEMAPHVRDLQTMLANQVAENVVTGAPHHSVGTPMETTTGSGNGGMVTRHPSTSTPGGVIMGSLPPQ